MDRSVARVSVPVLTAVLAGGLLLGPAGGASGADGVSAVDRPATARVAGPDPVTAVARKPDLKRWWRVVKVQQRPTAGAAAGMPRRQAICKSPDARKHGVLTVKLSRKTGWSVFGVGPVPGRGVVTIVSRYPTKAKARARMSRVRNLLLQRCPGQFRAPHGDLVRQRAFKLTATGLTGIRSFQTVENMGPDYSSYSVITRRGRAVFFTRFGAADEFSGNPPKTAPRKARKAMNGLQRRMQNRYNQR